MNAGFYSTSGGMGDRECGYWTGIMNSAKVGVQISLPTLMKFAKICTTEMAYLPQNMFCNALCELLVCELAIPPSSPALAMVHQQVILLFVNVKCSKIKSAYVFKDLQSSLPFFSNLTTHLLTFSNHAGSHTLLFLCNGIDLRCLLRCCSKAKRIPRLLELVVDACWGVRLPLCPL